jgi:hypothetical protein
MDGQLNPHSSDTLLALPHEGSTSFCTNVNLLFLKCEKDIMEHDRKMRDYK